jgi:hypothetical protein
MLCRKILKNYTKTIFRFFSTKDDKFWEEYTKMKAQGGKYPVLGTQGIIANNTNYSWKYSDKHSLINSEFYECISQLKPDDVASFIILDVREEIEYELYRLPHKNKVNKSLTARIM